jgi:hypothetical protein
MQPHLLDDIERHRCRFDAELLDLLQELARPHRTGGEHALRGGAEAVLVGNRRVVAVADRRPDLRIIETQERLHRRPLDRRRRTIDERE